VLEGAVHDNTGYKPLDLKNFVHCGLRDLNDIERSRVAGQDTLLYGVILKATSTSRQN
jgi:hypothetical protein